MTTTNGSTMPGSSASWASSSAIPTTGPACAPCARARTPHSHEREKDLLQPPQIRLRRQAVIAARNEGQRDVAAAEALGETQAGLPGNLGIGRPVDEANRSGEGERPAQH